MIHENASHKSDEAKFSAILLAKGFTVYPLKKFYPCDFMIEGPSGGCLAEYKRRHMPSSRYSAAIIPAQKWAACKVLARELRLPLFIFFQYDDALLYANADDISFKIRYSGRQDRGQDEREPMAELQLSDFKTLNLLPIRYQNIMDNNLVADTSLI